MNAQEARELSEKNFIKTEIVLMDVENMAKSGGTSILLLNVGKETELELMRLGYKISIHKDPINGFESFICSW